MDESNHRRRLLRGVLRRRLLINALVDPDEAARHLPAGLRPHVSEGRTVVGCCLLDVDDLRPVPLPATFGTRLRAAAHRISVEWDDGPGSSTVGVYVPMRHTDSRAARAIGGRWFPGVQQDAAIELDDEDGRLRWSVEPCDRANGHAIRVVVSPRADSSLPDEPIGGICLGAVVGLSLDHHGEFEAARMEPENRRARPVEVDHLESGFLARFATAEPAPSYLMRDVDVTWAYEPTPPYVRAGAPA